MCQGSAHQQKKIKKVQNYIAKIWVNIADGTETF